MHTQTGGEQEGRRHAAPRASAAAATAGISMRERMMYESLGDAMQPPLSAADSQRVADGDLLDKAAYRDAQKVRRLFCPSPSPPRLDMAER